MKNKLQFNKKKKNLKPETSQCHPQGEPRGGGHEARNITVSPSGWAQRCGDSPAGQEASGLSLEGDDDDDEFEVALFLQLGEDAGPEEHLTLTNTVQVGVQVQVQVLHLCYNTSYT